jgi:hypothetical protein
MKRPRLGRGSKPVAAGWCGESGNCPPTEHGIVHRIGKNSGGQYGLAQNALVAQSYCNKSSEGAGLNDAGELLAYGAKACRTISRFGQVVPRTHCIVGGRRFAELSIQAASGETPGCGSFLCARAECESFSMRIFRTRYGGVHLRRPGCRNSSTWDSCPIPRAATGCLSFAGCGFFMRWGELTGPPMEWMLDGTRVRFDLGAAGFPKKPWERSLTSIRGNRFSN